MAIDEHTLTLETLGYGGEALGRLSDGRVVFVPFGLPGEQVRVRLVEQKERYARGELLEVIRPSPDRIAPRCKHFGACGGCHYQHMDYETQLRVKTQILRDQLKRIAHIDEPPVLSAVGSTSPWNYRNHVQFHLDDRGRLGYVRAPTGAKTAKSILPIEECHLPEASINLLWPQLAFEPDSEVERVSIRAGTDEELLLVLESGSPQTPELEMEAGLSVAHVFAGDCTVLAGEGHVTLSILNREFRVSAPSFFQVNSAAAEKMVEHLLGNLPSSTPTILDVYCGVGLFSAFLAPRCTKLIGIESSSAACEDYQANLEEYDHVELYEDFAERALPALRIRPDAVVVDPPRAGLEIKALEALTDMSPRWLAYVSCDAATLARDAARLIAAGYQLRQVTPFDLFPQTYHIESTSIFER